MTMGQPSIENGWTTHNVENDETMAGQGAPFAGAALAPATAAERRSV